MPSSQRVFPMFRAAGVGRTALDMGSPLQSPSAPLAVASELQGPAQCYSLRCVSKGGENTDSGSITAHADHRHHVHAGENGHTYIWMAKETHQHTSEVTCSTCSPRLDDKAMSSKTVWQVQKIIESRCLNSQDMTRAGPLPAPS